MEELLKYFKDYYTKYYGAYDFVITDSVFACKLENDPKWGHNFKFNLLTAEKYEHMKKKQVLDRYLELMLIYYSELRHAEIARLGAPCNEYAYFDTEETAVSKRDEWGAYVTKDNLNYIIEVNDTKYYMVEVYKNNIQIFDAIYADKSRSWKNLPYYGEIEIVDAILSSR